MTRRIGARAPGILLGSGLVAAILLFDSTATWRDDRQLALSNPRGIPLQILTDSAVASVYRSIGYVSALTSQEPLDRVYVGTFDRPASPARDFLGAEVARYARLTSETFHTPSVMGFYAKVLKDDASRRFYRRLMMRQMKASDATYAAKRPSPKIGAMIRQDIDDLGKLGLAGWAGYDYETYAAYWFAIGRDTLGLRYLREAFETYRANGDLPLAANSAYKLGLNLLRMGEWEGAERAILDGYSCASWAGDRVFISRSVYSLALLRASQGYFAEAETLLARSVEGVRGIEDPTTEITELLGLADLYGDAGEQSRAGYLVDRAILGIERNLMDPSVAGNRNLAFNMTEYLASALARQAAIQIATGELEAAIATIRRALDVARRTRNDPLRGSLLGALGDASLARGRREEAERSYTEALRIARRRGLAQAEAEYLGDLGRLDIEAGRFRKAERRLGKALELAAPHAVEEAGLLRLMCLAKEGLGDYESGRRMCERAMGLLREDIAGRLDAGSRRRASGLVDSISSDLVLLESERFRNCDSLILAAEKWRALRAGTAGAWSAASDDEVRRAIASREWIPGDAAVIQLVVTPRRTIVIVMDRARREYRSVPIAAPELAAKVSSFARACAPRGDGSRDRAAASSEALAGARSLYRLLLEPVAPLLAGKGTWCFITDDALRALPIGSLVSPGEPPRFLIEEKTMLTSPGLVALARMSAAARGRGRESGVLLPAVLVGRSRASPLLRRLYPELDSLPRTQEEIDAIRRSIPGVVALTGASARKDEVVPRLAGAALIHIAAHGVRYPVYGGLPALVLSPPPGEAGGENVGASLLTAAEIARIDLSATRLAVISSCESGVGVHGERVWGFGVGGAFLDAGVRAVVATLWPVEDAAARDFAVAFYRELLRGEPDPATAVRRTRARMIEEDRAAGNAFRRIEVWAPYTLIGSFAGSP